MGDYDVTELLAERLLWEKVEDVFGEDAKLVVSNLEINNYNTTNIEEVNNYYSNNVSVTIINEITFSEDEYDEQEKRYEREFMESNRRFMKRLLG